MIDFIYKLNDVLPSWPNGSKWNLKQISEATQTSLPHVLQFLCEGLGKEVDISATIGLDEATEAILYLSKRVKNQIEQREREFAEKRAKALTTYEKLCEKIRQTQMLGNWHNAFRTLSYFAGESEAVLPRETMLTVVSEIIRTGIKAQANIQELGQWLQKGIAIGMSYHSKDGLEEALDLIDAYGEHFLADDSGKGPLVIGNILAVLEEPCARYELWENYKNMINQLYPAQS
mgnify:CR=1 FL=1